MSAFPGTIDATGRERLLGYSPIILAVMVQVLVWSVGPALVFGNLHSDTLEAAYWGRDLALGYAKHPPLATWIIDAVLRPGLPPVLSLMLLSQAGMAVAAFFVWKTVRLYASTQTAAYAVLLFFVAPATTIYAVQINHNSLLAPFWAASLYFGLAYLEERRWSDAIGLAIAAGLGFITKYEIVFVLVGLVTAAAIVPRFRKAFAEAPSYLCVFVFFAVIAPHIWWLDANGWPSATRAMGSDKMHSVSSLNLSAVNAIVGQFTLFAAPVAVLLLTMNRRADDLTARAPDLRRIAAIVGFGPPAILLAGAAATLQIVKPLWVLPLSASVAVGLALLFPAGSGGKGWSERASATWLMILSPLLFAGFAVYLVVAGALGKPLAAYSADTRKLARAVEVMWASHHSTPLRCVVIDDRKIGPSGVLFMHGRPDYVDFSSPSWATPRQIGECRRSGAIAALAEPGAALDNFPSACRSSAVRFEVPAMPGMGKVTWPVELVYVPPEGTGAICDAPTR